MKLLEKKANERGDRTYHKIVYGAGAAPDDLLSQTQPKIKAASNCNSKPSTPMSMYHAKQQEMLSLIAFKS